jgi:NADPH:quinone reductase-like Zn-dependent oxidoreductase
MNTAVVRAYDAPPLYWTFEEPVAAEGEVLVNVRAAGLHPLGAGRVIAAIQNPEALGGRLL